MGNMLRAFELEERELDPDDPWKNSYKLVNELHLEGYKIECNKHVITKVIRYS
jgi:hypothetical protein